MASASEDGTIKIWDAQSGSELRTFSGFETVNIEIDISPDGQTLIGADETRIRVWNVADGAEIAVLELGPNLATTVRDLALSADGDTVALCGRENVRLWSIQRKSVVATLSGPKGLYTYPVFSADGSLLAASNADRTVQIWAVKSRKLLKSLAGHADYVYHSAFSPDATTIATGSKDGTVKLWNVQKGTVIRTITGISTEVGNVRFMENGKQLAGSDGHYLRFWDVESGALLRTLSGTVGEISDFTILPGQRFLINSLFEDARLRVWDLEKGTESILDTKPSGDTNRVRISPDGNTVVTINGGDVQVWGIEADSSFKTWRAHGHLINTISFTPNGAQLATASFDNTVKIWEINTGNLVRTLTSKSKCIFFLARFTSDGTRLLTQESCEEGGSKSRSVYQLWDVNNWQRAATVNEKDVTRHVPDFFGGSMSDSATTNNGTVIWKPGVNGQIMLLASDDQRELGRLIGFSDGKWAVVTPDGRFDGANGAWKRIIWRLENKTFSYVPVEAFFNQYYSPGLLQEILSGTGRATDVMSSKGDIRQPVVRIVSIGGQPSSEGSFGAPANIPASIDTREVEVVVEVTESKGSDQPDLKRGSGAQDLRLFRNGILVKHWPEDVFRKSSPCATPSANKDLPRKTVCRAKVTLIAGDNEFSAYAFSSTNIKSNDYIVMANGAAALKRQGVLHLLAIGIDQYANTAFNLKYAVADARELTAEIQRQQGSLKRFGEVTVTTLYNDQATKKNIIGALAEIQLRARPEDTVMILFAGHGLADEPRFYLVPHDLGYQGARTRAELTPQLNQIFAHGISDEELAASLEAIDAGQILFIIDACNSGQILEAAEKRRGPMNSRGLAQLAYEKGMYILTAAQSYQAALEAARLGHGYLTYALVEEGLKQGQADIAPNDGRILVREWFNFASRRVPQLQRELLNETRLLVQTPVVFVEGDEKKTQQAQPQLQVPRLFYRREAEADQFLVWERSTPTRP